VSIDLHEEAAGGILVVKLHGTLAKGDYAKFTKQAEQLIGKHGRLRILCHMQGFHGWEAEAPQEDLEFYFKHLNDIERLAFIGDQASEDGMAAFYKPFAAAQIRYFDESKAEEAREWIYAGLCIS
jgi:hypothetical protein